MGIHSKNVRFSPPVSYPHLGWKNLCSVENGIMFSSLQPQLTPVSYSALHYLSNSILSRKPESKDYPLCPSSSTSDSSPSAISSILSQFVPLHLLCYTLVQSWTIQYPPPTYQSLYCSLPTNSSPEWALPYGHWINHLPANALLRLPLIYGFKPKLLTVVFKALKDGQPHLQQFSPWATVSSYSRHLLILGCCCGPNCAPQPSFMCWSCKPSKPVCYDGSWRWGLWKILKFRWGHEGRVLVMELMS